MMNRDYLAGLGLAGIHDKILAGERITPEDGLDLLNCPDPLAVGALANHRRQDMHGRKAFYVINQHINYTNICVNGCTFCAYQRKEGESGGFKLTPAEALAKIDTTNGDPREIHIVGGCHPKLKLDYFEELLSGIRGKFPDTVLKCFTAVEIAHFAELEGMDTSEVLTRLKAAGLNMLPGGGAEIFEHTTRKTICPNKIDAERWLAIHEQAHSMGIKSNCTMLFGHLESLEDRVDHLDQLRKLQDRTDGFVCFIPLPFLTENSMLKIDQPLTGLDELKTIAVSRLMLDNIPHIKAYWVMLTVKQAQTALHFGADDFDGTVVEEKIGHEAGAGTEQALTRSALEEMIQGCGFTPVERDSFFNIIREGGQS